MDSKYIIPRGRHVSSPCERSSEETSREKEKLCRDCRKKEDAYTFTSEHLLIDPNNPLSILPSPPLITPIYSVPEVNQDN